jgi:hypothetical protein
VLNVVSEAGEAGLDSQVPLELRGDFAVLPKKASELESGCEHPPDVAELTSVGYGAAPHAFHGARHVRDVEGRQASTLTGQLKGLRRKPSTSPGLSLVRRRLQSDETSSSELAHRPA